MKNVFTSYSWQHLDILLSPRSKVIHIVWTIEIKIFESDTKIDRSRKLSPIKEHNCPKVQLHTKVLDNK